MSDGNTKDGDRKGKTTLGVRSGGTETSHVRQSFSHGRTKSVTVEHKRKRILVPKPGASASAQRARLFAASRRVCCTRSSRLRRRGA